VAALRRFVRARAESERCELCSAELGPVHRHLLEMAKRQVVCACDPCALRFHDVVDGRFKLIPRDARALLGFRLTDAQWERTRFTFGRVYPEAYSISQHGAEPFIMQTECLVQSASAPAIGISVRFLHPMAREVGALATASAELSDDAQPESVPELRVDGRLYQTWQEAVERTVVVPSQPLKALAERALELPFTFPSSRTSEAIRNDAGHAVGVILRRQEALQGRIEVVAASIDAQVFKRQSRRAS
jgi:hypothetical protein